MTVKEVSNFNTDRILIRCITRNLYTRGNSEDYARMFVFADDAEVTTENILTIAKNIAQHSDLQACGCTYHEAVENLMYFLANECVVRNFEFEW